MSNALLFLLKTRAFFMKGRIVVDLISTEQLQLCSCVLFIKLNL